MLFLNVLMKVFQNRLSLSSSRPTKLWTKTKIFGDFFRISERVFFDNFQLIEFWCFAGTKSFPDFPRRAASFSRMKSAKDWAGSLFYDFCRLVWASRCVKVTEIFGKKLQYRKCLILFSFNWLLVLTAWRLHRLVTNWFSWSSLPGNRRDDSIKREVCLFSPSDLTNMSVSEQWVFSQALQLITLNDCLYRNMFTYNRIAILDTDELIVPDTIAPNGLKTLLKSMSTILKLFRFTFWFLVFRKVEEQQQLRSVNVRIRERRFYTNCDSFLNLKSGSKSAKSSVKRMTNLIKYDTYASEFLVSSHHFLAPNGNENISNFVPFCRNCLCESGSSSTSRPS